MHFEHATTARYASGREETFGELSEGDDKPTIRRYARAYMMILLGTQLFADKSGNHIYIRWLSYVTRLEDMGGYCWGSAVLSWLYWCMCRVANRHVDGKWGPTENTGNAENGDGDNYLPTTGIGTGIGINSGGGDGEQGGIPRPIDIAMVKLAGPLQLLQSWIFWRFPEFRPAGYDTFSWPLVSRWSSRSTEIGMR
ncbi:hypothetical protein Ahy_A04g018284 [Arachis hypogaea]|uniref:Aminotransferase-like plant mobile domain-containing protein n=1 Tax=Arachis hypogaea TaxID=3818 RepID=A0A445DD90_ARAHY|nr:hypothetical protein Ahy_A04g018284 [Arachis hypogaea]